LELSGALEEITVGFRGDSNSSSITFSSRRAIAGGHDARDVFGELNIPIASATGAGDAASPFVIRDAGNQIVRVDNPRGTSSATSTTCSTKPRATAQIVGRAGERACKSSIRPRTSTTGSAGTSSSARA
jgi:hypothetical protein